MVSHYLFFGAIMALAAAGPITFDPDAVEVEEPPSNCESWCTKRKGTAYCCRYIDDDPGVTRAEEEKPGYCPNRNACPTNKRNVHYCSTDIDCTGIKKCCSDGCGTLPVCKKPKNQRRNRNRRRKNNRRRKHKETIPDGNEDEPTAWVVNSDSPTAAIGVVERQYQGGSNGQDLISEILSQVFPARINNAVHGGGINIGNGGGITQEGEFGQWTGSGSNFGASREFGHGVPQEAGSATHQGSEAGSGHHGTGHFKPGAGFDHGTDYFIPGAGSDHGTGHFNAGAGFGGGTGHFNPGSGFGHGIGHFNPRTGPSHHRAGYFNPGAGPGHATGHFNPGDGFGRLLDHFNPVGGFGHGAGHFNSAGGFRQGSA